jgi:hypothetical protein
MVDNIFLAFKIASIAYMYAGPLTQPGHIFSRWKNMLSEMLDGKDRDGKYLTRWHWLYDPLIGCTICVAGEMMLWSLVILNYFPQFMRVIDVCFLIMLAISIAHIFKNIDRK